MNKKIKLFRSKKGSSYWFIYVMAFIFLLGIMYIIFSEILQVYIYPTTQFLSQDVSTGTAKPDRFIGFWGFTPFVILFVTLLYLFLKSTQKDDNSTQ